MSVAWGIAGTGGIAGRFATALGRVADARLVAVASRRADTASAFAAEHAIPRSYAGLDAMLADPSLDVVYLASPHSEHCPQALLALEAGKHVLVEKPMALSFAEVSAMVERASSQGLFLMEAMWTRFLPSFVRLRELVADRAVGDVVSVEATLGFVTPFVADHRLYRPELGGGALLDLGTYPVQLALMLLGRPVEIDATGQLGPTGVDHDTTVRMAFGSGPTATARCSLVAELPNTGRITAGAGWIELASPVYAPAALTLGATDDPVGVREELPDGGDGLRYQVEEVHRCLYDGRVQSDVMPWADSLVLAQTLDRARADVGLRFPGEA